MACTSTYIYGKTTVTNSGCFSGLTNKTDDIQLIIIESEKFCFSRNRIDTYLHDLIEIGYDVSFKYDKQKKQYRINTVNLKGFAMRVSFSMAVRYLWEGFYNPVPNAYTSNYDNFVDVIRHYFKLKQLLPNETNKFLLLCIACNCYIKSNQKFNSNHFFTYNLGCKLFSSLEELKNKDSVNGTFTRPQNQKIIQFENRKDADNWTNKDYKDILKELNYE